MERSLFVKQLHVETDTLTTIRVIEEVTTTAQAATVNIMAIIVVTPTLILAQTAMIPTQTATAMIPTLIAIVTILILVQEAVLGLAVDLVWVVLGRGLAVDLVVVWVKR